jgi:hypothetical protein
LETTSGTTRVAFLCRDAGAISEPILSRTTLVGVDSPDATEIVYELLRRTESKVERAALEGVAARSHGNLRTALLEALVLRHCSSKQQQEQQEQQKAALADLLASRPKDKGLDWIPWAIRAVQTCKEEGYDLRDLLREGWPKHPVVGQVCTAWSRLGGTSPRALFYASIAKLG